MKLELHDGKTYEVNAIVPTLRGGERIIVDMPTEGRKLSEIAPDFEGNAIMQAQDENRGSGVFDVYKGYTELVGLTKDKTRGAIRLTLERSDGA